jgi:demethylmenaquinone methyltransferase/2-methoxy-6-polyprenyl-1,4-benzoquinol methylase
MSSSPLPPSPHRSSILPATSTRRRGRRSCRPVDDRREFVIDLFDRTAPHYNWLNRVMSLSAQVSISPDALERAGLTAEARFSTSLGTGLTAQAALARHRWLRGSVACVDAASACCRSAFPRHLTCSSGSRAAADCDTLVRLFDGVAHYGTTDLKATFREYHRVLRPSGRLVIPRAYAAPRLRLAIRAHALVSQEGRAVLGAQLGSGSSPRLMEYHWDTIDGCVPPMVTESP